MNPAEIVDAGIVLVGGEVIPVPDGNVLVGVAVYGGLLGLLAIWMVVRSNRKMGW